MDYGLRIFDELYRQRRFEPDQLVAGSGRFRCAAPWLDRDNLGEGAAGMAGVWTETRTETRRVNAVFPKGYCRGKPGSV